MTRTTMPEYKQGDTYPDISDTIEDDSGPYDLTGASVRFIMSYTDGTAKVNSAATIAADQVTNRGRVSYTPGVNDMDTVGIFNWEWQVTLGNGRVQTIPNGAGRYYQLMVTADLGD